MIYTLIIVSINKKLCWGKFTIVISIYYDIVYMICNKYLLFRESMFKLQFQWLSVVVLNNKLLTENYFCFCYSKHYLPSISTLLLYSSILICLMCAPVSPSWSFLPPLPLLSIRCVWACVLIAMAVIEQSSTSKGKDTPATKRYHSPCSFTRDARRDRKSSNTASCWTSVLRHSSRWKIWWAWPIISQCPGKQHSGMGKEKKKAAKRNSIPWW